MTPEDGTRELPSETTLLRNLKAGESAAFEVMVRTNTPRLLAVARRYLPKEADAQDAVQDAFLSAFRGIAGFTGASKLSTWLHRIVVNASLMKLRTRRRKPEVAIDDLLPRFEDDASAHHVDIIAAWRETAPDELTRDENRAMVREAIERLPDSYREVLTLRDIEQIDTTEVAEMLGVSKGVVKTRLHRARQALRALLDPHFKEEGP